MENLKDDKKEQEIVFSKSVKAGKRIYYLDVKRSRNDDLFLSITESKKVVTGDIDNPQVSFTKHKIFLYKEDFEKFTDSLNEVIDFIQQALPENTEIKEHLEDISTDEKPRTTLDNFDIDFNL